MIAKYPLCLQSENPAPQDSPPAAGREATNSVPPQCDPRGALFCFIGNATQFPIKQKGDLPSDKSLSKSFHIEISSFRLQPWSDG